jgi:hypothetical protein
LFKKLKTVMLLASLLSISTLVAVGGFYIFDLQHGGFRGQGFRGHGVIALEWPLSEFSIRGLRISASINLEGE